jgi:hypothetical protein
MMSAQSLPFWSRERELARSGRIAHHVRGVSKINAFRCLPARKRNTPLGTVTSSIHEDL